MAAKIQNCSIRIIADNGSVGHGSNGSTNLDGHVGHESVLVTHDPLSAESMKISRTISVTFGAVFDI